MTSEDAAAAVRKEVTDFHNGWGAYVSPDLSEQEGIRLFLERNYVVRIPEEGLLEVTRDGNMIKINGKNYTSNPDQFEWQQVVRESEAYLEKCGELLRTAVLDVEKAKAVQAFLAQEQEAAKQRDMDREKRLEELAREYYGCPFRAVTGLMGVRMLERLADLEQQLAAAS